MNEEERRLTSYEILSEIVGQRVKTLFRDEEGEVCAIIQNDEHLEVWPVRSKTFDSYLNSWFYEAQGKGVRAEVRRDIIATLEAMGNSRDTVALNLFSCLSEEGSSTVIWVDLYTPDWRGVLIDADGIKIAPLPRSFRRFKHLSTWNPEFPKPEENPREIIEHFLRTVIPNPQNPETYRLLTASLPVYILPIPRPILVFLGGHGSGKSEAQKMISRVFLKEGAPSCWGNSKDLSSVARQNPILLYDNVTKISEELARFLSVTVTGELTGCRELYTDKEVVYLRFKRAILLNGIAPNIYSYPDLVDRSLIVTLEKIDEKNRKEEKELEEELRPLFPRVFGACLESLRRAIPLLQQVRNDLKGKLPRMADFAIWGEAVARGMGYQPFEWFNLYGQFKRETLIEVVEANPVSRTLQRLVELNRGAPELDREQAQTLLKDMEQRGEGLVFKVKGTNETVWMGSVTVLHNTLKRLLDDPMETDFPPNPAWLTKRLKMLQSTLSDLGIRISFCRGKDTNRIVIRWMM